MLMHMPLRQLCMANNVMYNCLTLWMTYQKVHINVNDLPLKKCLLKPGMEINEGA